MYSSVQFILFLMLAFNDVLAVFDIDILYFETTLL